MQEHTMNTSPTAKQQYNANCIKSILPQAFTTLRRSPHISRRTAFDPEWIRRTPNVDEATRLMPLEDFTFTFKKNKKQVTPAMNAINLFESIIK